MNIFGGGKFIENLDGLVFHRENLTGEDRLFIDDFVKQHQIANYRTASEINSIWIISQDKSSLMFRLGGGLPANHGNDRTPVGYGLIFEGQPLVFTADIRPYYSITQAHWNILELIIHPDSFFSKIPKNRIFKIIEYFIKNAYQSERLTFIPEDIAVNFSTFKRIRAVGDHRIFGNKS